MCYVLSATALHICAVPHGICLILSLISKTHTDTGFHSTPNIVTNHGNVTETPLQIAIMEGDIAKTELRELLITPKFTSDLVILLTHFMI